MDEIQANPASKIDSRLGGSFDTVAMYAIHYVIVTLASYLAGGLYASLYVLGSHVGFEAIGRLLANQCKASIVTRAVVFLFGMNAGAAGAYFLIRCMINLPVYGWILESLLVLSIVLSFGWFRAFGDIIARRRSQRSGV